MDSATFTEEIQLDQFQAVQEQILISVPIDIFLSATIVFVNWHAGRGGSGLGWFAFSLTISLVRMFVCRSAVFQLAHAPGSPASKGIVFGRLRLHCLMALIAGGTWAYIPVLTGSAEASLTPLYLAIVCMVTGGAVAHGVANARVAICFIAPPLISAAVSLTVFGGFDNRLLAGATALYLVGLMRDAMFSESRAKVKAG